MSEGDTIFRAARTLSRALSGRVVIEFATELPGLAVVDRRAPIAGRTIGDVAAHGKHLTIEFSGDLLLRTHMRMHGSWHLYRLGERWRAAARDARIVLSTDPWVAIAFRVSDAEFLAASARSRHARLAALGPDLLTDAFDGPVARQRLRETPSRHVADAIVRQQSLAGLGNVFKSELLFLCRIHPFVAVDTVSDAALDRLIELARRLIRLNVEVAPVAAGGRTGRFTTGRLHPGERLWVYGRAGQPCFTCGTPVASKSETAGRRTYWCPRCQPAT